MKIVKRDEAPVLETVKGRLGVILQSGERAMLILNTIEPGIPTPPHSHPHEQMGYILEGRAVLFSGGRSVEIAAGTSFQIPPNEPHNFDATGDGPAVILEAFSPPREDYLERVKKEGRRPIKGK